MNPKNAFIGIFLLSLTILSFSVVSADTLQEFLSDEVTQITVTVNQNTSQVDFFLDTSGTSFDRQNVDIQNETVGGVQVHRIAFSFDISEFLGDINGEVEVERDSDTPQFNSLTVTENGLVEIESIQIDSWSISGGISPKDVLQNIFDNLDLNSALNISDITSVNNYLTANPLSIASDRHVVFTKQGTNYTIWNDEGYGNVPEAWKVEIREKIENGIEAINLAEIFESIIPFLEENELNLSLFDDLDMEYTVGEIDLSDIVLQDGNYTISVPIQKNDGSASYTKSITLVVQGIQNEEIDRSVTDGTYTPTNLEVARYLIRISGLSTNTIDVLLLDDRSLLPFNTLPSNTRSVIKYMNITPSDNPLLGGTIEFKVPTSSVSNPSLVSLWVLDGSTWTQLPTSPIDTSGGFYEYEATTSHFSTFMIMETLQTSSGGGGGRHRGLLEGIVPQVPTSPAPGGPAPIEATPSPPTQGFFATITGAFIGALTSPTGLVVLIFVLIGIVAVALVIRNFGGSKGEGKKGGKLNEKGDKNDT